MTAGKYNRTQGITGGLMFNKNYFGQVLEGTREAVSKLFCDIANDPRHRSIVIVEASTVQHRLFDRWAMGLADKTETANEVDYGYDFKNGFDPTEMTSPNFVGYILKMVSLEDKVISVSVPTW